jgi:hypothetical protein
VLLQHLILGWCVSQRDLEVVRKILQQICVAYAPEGGTKVRTSSSPSFQQQHQRNCSRGSLNKPLGAACNSAVRVQMQSSALGLA